ncbi:DUF4166 domain-containing protein [Phyllobacterium sp. P30BS-XVII]|uniref:DUF4166 domain-containing protein n=1 Tax=Phyllobacterium sp. P30BS-XVII TaxID=2587046 RepID=UPI0017E7ADD4|nr:DUF4166 domain-containing protein [Phyllobacterium sp. P30BS-XVII]MBA8902310.1 hypothetical protein [Phyllobacterium sp. P30BS-XVII]
MKDGKIERTGDAENHLPVFQAVLGDAWHDLGDIVKRHYSLQPYSNDYICVSGTMQEVQHSAIGKLLIPFGWIFGALVPYRGTNVPIDVHYNSHRDNGLIYWDRVFQFPGHRPFHFRSHMEQIDGNRVVEFVRFGVGLRLRVTAEDGALVFRDEGYIWRLFGIDVPIPVGLLFGSAYVEERPVDAQNFSMKMTLCHPLLGELFRYSGRFVIKPDIARSS